MFDEGVCVGGWVTNTSAELVLVAWPACYDSGYRAQGLGISSVDRKTEAVESWLVEVLKDMLPRVESQTRHLETVNPAVLPSTSTTTRIVFLAIPTGAHTVEACTWRGT